MGKKLQLGGLRFGNLLVLREVTQRGDRRTTWLCQCDCGMNVVVPGYKMKSGHTQGCRSCGWIKAGITRKGGELSSGTWRIIINGARDRSLAFEITREEALQKFVDQKRKCALTGVDLVLKRNTGEPRSKVTASLDRIDSSKGYFLSNVQWVHKIINIMKKNMPEALFIEWCSKVAVHWEKTKCLTSSTISTRGNLLCAPLGLPVIQCT